jgi:large subunit ribosomal protein L21
MYAVIETGGKQYRVSEGDTLRVEKTEGNPGDEIVLDRVLLLGEGENLKVGNPFLEDVRVRAEVLAQRKAKKIVVFKFKRRKKYRRKKGHRQPFTGLRIKTIETLTSGQSESEAQHGT